MSSSGRSRAASLVLLVAVVALFGAAACAGSSDGDAALDDAPVPRPLVTATAYVPNSVRVNYHTDLIVFMSPTSGSQELQGVEAIVESLPVQSALLITSERAYEEARCLLAGRTDVMNTLAPELVPSQFRLDFGGDQAAIAQARDQLSGLAGVTRVTVADESTAGAAGAASGGGSGGGTAAAASPTQCQAEGIRIK